MKSLSREAFRGLTRAAFCLALSFAVHALLLGASSASAQTPMLVDVSSQCSISTSNERTRYDRRTRMMIKTADITIANSSNAPISTPAHAVFVVSSSQVSMPGMLGGPGVAPYNYYFKDVSTDIGDETLSPGESITFGAEFMHSSRVRFTYSVKLYAPEQGSDNIPPVAAAGDDQTIQLQTGQESAEVTLNGSGSSDPDGQVLGYSWSGTPDPVDTVSPTVTLSPGEYTFSLIVTDDDGSDSAPDTVIITVNEAPNIPPTANAGPDQSIQLEEGQASAQVTLDGSASGDIDGTVGSYQWTGNPDPADQIDPIVELTHGTYYFSLTVTDNDGTESTTDEVAITVLPPVIQNIPPEANAGEDREFQLEQGQDSIEATLDASASSDSDGQVTAYEWSGSPNPEDVAAPQVTLTPGIYDFSLVVTDDDAERSAPDMVQITVLAAPLPNTPPQLTLTPPSATIAEGQTLTISVDASDADNEPVSLSATPRLENAAFTATSGIPATGTFSFTPDTDQPGLYAVAFTTRDPHGAAATKVALITVTEINHAPTISAEDPPAVDEGSLLVLQVATSDEDGDTVDTSAEGLPDNAVFIPSTNSLTFAPDYEQAGTYAVTFTASDGVLESSPLTVTLQVNDVTVGGTGQDATLVLNVNPVQSPTLLESQRITGSVNSDSGTLPAVQPPVSALVTNMTHASGMQGSTLDVVIVGEDSRFLPAFEQGVTTAHFGADITVNSIVVQTPTQATVNISVSRDAVLGNRAVSLSTSGQTAVSLLAFRVTSGVTQVIGTLVDPGTGLPISGAVITVQGTNLSTVSGAAGSFALTGIPAGIHTLLVNSPNHKFFSITVDAQANATIDLGSLGSAATVFDPSAPDTLSLLSVVGRGASDPVAVSDKEQTKQIIRDAVLLVGDNELGLLDQYGNQVNTLLSDDGPVSITEAGVERLADHMLRDVSYSLASFLFSVSYGFEWAGTGERFTLDDWLEAMQTQVNIAWANPTNPDNALAIMAFNQGRTLSPEPPTLSHLTRMNALQAYLLGTSLLLDMKNRTDDLASLSSLTPRYAALKQLESAVSILADAVVPKAYAQVAPAGRFSGYWRMAVDDLHGTKGSFPKLIGSQFNAVMARDATVMTLSQATGIIGATHATYVAGQLEDAISSYIDTIIAQARLPEPPVLSGLERTPSGVVVSFREGGVYNGYTTKRHIFTLLYFENPSAKPRVAEMQLRFGFDPIAGPVTDVAPATSGTGFYAMTSSLIRRYGDYLTETGLSKAAVSPWWGVASSTPAGDDRASYLDFWNTMNTAALTSDFSNPLLFEADPLPDLGSIDAIAVDLENFGDVFVSNTAEKTLLKMANLHRYLGTPELVANAGFADPGQKGLGIDASGNLYTDNAASDAMYGGRLFRFLYTGSRELVGSINYFSQPLGYANPVSSGPMCIGPDQGLYVMDRITRYAKRVDVNATYDPNRRVGKGFFNLSGFADSNVIDMEWQHEVGKVPMLYMLTGSEILGTPRVLDSSGSYVGGTGGDNIRLEEDL